MSTDLSAERAAFEAWLNPGRHDGNVSPWVEPGRYSDGTHNIAWLAWRYGREAQAAEIARLRAALETIARHLSSDWPGACQSNVWIARTALKDAAREST